MDNVKVFVRKIYLRDTVSYTYASVFNVDNIIYTGNEYELTDVIDISTIIYEQTEVSAESILELVRKSNDTTLTLSGIQNDYKDIFDVKSNPDTTNIYQFWFKYKDTIVFSGIAKEGDITFEENPTPDSDNITINITSLQNHFFDYFNFYDCDLNEVESVFSSQAIIPNTDCKYCDIEKFFKKFFFDNKTGFFVKNNTGINWNMNRQPFLYSWPSDTAKYSFLKNGFRKMALETTPPTKTDFFVKLCNTMGWELSLVFNENNEVTLNIFNRVRTEYGIAMDGSRIMSVKYNKKFEETEVDYVVIEDGRVKGGINYNTPDAVPTKIISLNDEYDLFGHFFYRARLTDDYSGFNLYPYAYPNYYLISNHTPQGDYLDFAKVRYTDILYWYSRTTERLKITNNKILYIESGVNTKGTLQDMTNGVLTLDADDLGSSLWDIWYTGNYGSMLFWIEETNGYTSYYSFDEYSRTSTFKDNMKALLYNSSYNVLEIKFSGIFPSYYTDDYRDILLTDANTFLDGEWKIIRNELNLKEETSTLTLKKII